MPDAGGAPYQHRATRAIQRMVEFAPSTGGLALWVRHQDAPDGVDMPLAWTDGNTIFYGAAFERLPLAEQTGVVAHEVLHVALRHPQRFLDLRRLLGDVDLQLFNICADAIVNSTLGHLSWLRLPASSVHLEHLLATALDLRETAEVSLLRWDVERLYRAVDDRRMPDQNKRQQGGNGDRANASGRGQSHNHAASHAASEQNPARTREDGRNSTRARSLGASSQADLAPSEGAQGSPEAEAEHAREQSERLMRGHASDGAFSMLRALIADLPKTRTPWEQVLRTRLARALARKPDVSWSRPTRSYIANQGRIGPDRRLPWEPGFSPTKTVPRLVVIVDVSGSINFDLLKRFSGEIEAITRRQESGLVLIIGDERVRRVKIFEPGRVDLREIEFHGGGGTDFTPLLEEANKHRPDIAVVLTDLEGPARFRPHWPVIWAVPPSHADAVQPFGRKLVLDD
jgi:predicted metal-dependent peptidase